MTVKELKEILNKYPDEMLVLVKAEDGGETYAYDMWKNAIRANVEQGDILAEENNFDEDDEDDENIFNEKDCVLLLDATR